MESQAVDAVGDGVMLHGDDVVVVVVVTLSGQRCAIDAAAVREVLPAARPAVLADAPAKVLGLLNLRAEPVIVIDGGTCLGHPAAPLRPSDRFVVLAGPEPTTAVRVDAVHDVATIGGKDLRAGIALGDQAVTHAGVAVLPDGLLVIHDPATFVTSADAATFRQILERQGAT